MVDALLLPSRFTVGLVKVGWWEGGYPAYRDLVPLWPYYSLVYDLASLGTPARPQVRHGHTADQQPWESLTAVEHALAELHIAETGVSVLPTYRHPCYRDSVLLTEVFNMAVCAPWGEAEVHNGDKTAHRPAHR